MLRLLIYGVPGTPIFEVGERLAEFHKIDYFTIEKVPENHDSYFDDKIPEVSFDTGDFTNGSDSQHMVRDPKSLVLDEELESAEAGIPDAGPYEDCLNTQERFLVESIDQGIVTTEIPDRSLISWATHVVFLKSDERKVIRWFAKRVKCPSCKTVYHIEDKPSKIKGKCDRCGTVLEREEADDPKLIFDQFKAWKSSFWKFEETAKEEGHFKVINIDKMNKFSDLISRVDLYVRDAITTSDKWYSI